MLQCTCTFDVKKLKHFLFDFPEQTWDREGQTDNFCWGQDSKQSCSKRNRNILCIFASLDCNPFYHDLLSAGFCTFTVTSGYLSISSAGFYMGDCLCLKDNSSKARDIYAHVFLGLPNTGSVLYLCNNWSAWRFCPNHGSRWNWNTSWCLYSCTVLFCCCDVNFLCGEYIHLQVIFSVIRFSWEVNLVLSVVLRV